MFQLSPEPQETRSADEPQAQDGTTVGLTSDEPAQGSEPKPDAGGWWSDCPPGIQNPSALFPGLRKDVSEAQGSEPAPKEVSEVPEAPNGRWKILTDMPVFTRVAGAGF